MSHYDNGMDDSNAVIPKRSQCMHSQLYGQPLAFKHIDFLWLSEYLCVIKCNESRLIQIGRQIFLFAERKSALKKWL